MEKASIAQRFSRALSTYDAAATVQARMACRLLQLLRKTAGERPPHSWRHVAEVGCGTGLLSRLLRQQLQPEKLWLNDLCPDAAHAFADWPEATFRAGDIETLPLPDSLDLIISGATLQWMEQPALLLERCTAALRPGGRVALSTFAPGTLAEVRHLTGQGLPYPEPDTWAGMLRHAGLRVEQCLTEEQCLTFNTPTDVLRHLQLTGVTAAGHYRWTPRRLEAFSHAYRRQYSTPDGCVKLTFRPVYLIAQKNIMP